MNYIGMDIGTSGCKVVRFTDAGERVAVARREYPVLVPRPGWAELDSDVVMNACLSAIREVAVCAGERVAGIGVSSQGEAFTPVAADGSYLYNAMVSSDARAVNIAADWSREFGLGRLHQITGHTAHPMFSLFKLIWLRENMQDLWSRMDKVLCFEDLLAQRLGLEPAMGWPLAGRTMMFDIRRHEWSPEILDAVGLRPGQLAHPLISGSIVGKIPRGVASDLELPEDVVLVTGGHDQPCGALGAGAVRPEYSIYATGTVECMCPALSSPLITEALAQNNLCVYDHAMPGLYATVAFSLTGGNLLQWFKNEFCATEQARARASGDNVYDLILSQIDTQPAKLQVLPYFTPSGTPYFDANTPGAILGLRLTTRRGEILRALLEGVALEMRLNLNVLEESDVQVKELRAIGGGAQNKIWTQLKADVLGKPIVRVAESEAGCLGGAILACAACMKASPMTIADNWVKLVDTVKPNPELADFYATKFTNYKSMYPIMKGLQI